MMSIILTEKQKITNIGISLGRIQFFQI